MRRWFLPSPTWALQTHPKSETPAVHLRYLISSPGIKIQSFPLSWQRCQWYPRQRKNPDQQFSSDGGSRWDEHQTKQAGPWATFSPTPHCGRKKELLPQCAKMFNTRICLRVESIVLPSTAVAIIFRTRIHQSWPWPSWGRLRKALCFREPALETDWKRTGMRSTPPASWLYIKCAISKKWFMKSLQFCK